jgi:hypothetical protein
VAFNSYRYPRYHLSPPTRVGSPWTPGDAVDAETAEVSPPDEIDLTGIDLTTIDLREAQGAVTRF